METFFPSTAGTEARIASADSLMAEFADRGARYLWTDAFAVCNFLGLARVTGRQEYVSTALRLVEDVHSSLGRQRGAGAWISGLDEAAARAHPTAGGLRIGKMLPERGVDEPADPELEWDRDGQYFHYLTRWMHALDQVARFTGELRFNRWARELAARAFSAFTFSPPAGGRRRMVWKMSVDLSRVRVPSMGHHDPLDGYVTVAELRATAAALGGASDSPTLEEELSGFAEMIEGRDWETADPLGLGGLMLDLHRANLLGLSPSLRATLIEDIRDGLSLFGSHSELGRPAAYRLAFRELGLAIGLHALERLQISGRFTRWLPLAGEIESFWAAPSSQATETFAEHRDINEVMLASALVPDGVLLFGAHPHTGR